MAFNLELWLADHVTDDHERAIQFFRSVDGGWVVANAEPGGFDAGIGQTIEKACADWIKKNAWRPQYRLRDEDAEMRKVVRGY